MSAGHSAFQVRALRGRALLDRGLLRLILRWVRQRAFVVLDPSQIPRIDPAVARLASEKNDKARRRVACWRARRAPFRAVSVHRVT